MGGRTSLAARQQPGAPAGATTWRLIGVVAVGLMLAGCDKCNDWRIFNQSSLQQSCKGTAPVQQ